MSGIANGTTQYAEKIVNLDDEQGTLCVYGSQVIWSVVPEDIKVSSPTRTLRVTTEEDYYNYDVPSNEVVAVMNDIALGMRQPQCWIRGDLFQSSKIICVQVLEG